MKRVIRVKRIGTPVVALAILVGAVLTYNENATTTHAAVQSTGIYLSGGRILYASLATADFNGDGYKEIVAAGEDGMLYVVSTSDGENWSTVWSKQCNDDIEAANPPTSRSTNEFHASPAIADLDNDGHLDIVAAIGGSIHTTAGNRENGGVLVYTYDSEWSFSLIETLSGDGTRGWPQPRIDECGGGSGYSYPDGLWDGITTTPALGDLDGDGDLEIVVAGIDRRIHAWHHTGEVVAGWPIYRYNGDALLRGSYLSSPALGDIDDDGLPEVVVGTMSPPWGGEGSPDPDYNYGTIWAINGDSTNVPGWPVTTEQYIHSSPALGDIDNDGRLEVVSGVGWGTNQRENIVYAWNHDGTLLTNWPRTTQGVMPAPPALGDIDNDGDLEIVIGCGAHYSTTSCGDGTAKLYAWNANGTNVSGFPMQPETPNPWALGAYAMPYSPILADFDGDGDIEIVIAHHGAHGITIVDSDGSNSEQRYDSDLTGLQAPALVDDVDNDGKWEILAGGGSTNGFIRIWDENGTASAEARPWPMFHRDVQRTGLFPDYTIGGRVADYNGTPFSGVSVSISSGTSDSTDVSGIYEFTGLLDATYNLTPTLSGYAFWPVTHSVTLPSAGAQSQNFIILAEPVSTALTSGSAASLVYTDTQDLPTQLDFPAGAVSQPTTLVLTPTLAMGEAGFAFAGHAFELEAYQGGVWQPGFTFDTPVTITIRYSDTDVRVVSDENELLLRWWAGSAWQDAAETCSPASSYSRDTVSNTLSIPICHLSLLGMFGPTNNAYLPLVARNAH